MTMRHSKLAPACFVEQARPALSSFAEGSSRRLIEGVQKAKDAQIAKDEDDLMQFLGGRGFSRKRAVEIAETVEREEGAPARTIWDVAQGLTRLSQEIPFQDERVQLESEARKLLDKVA